MQCMRGHTMLTYANPISGHGGWHCPRCGTCGDFAVMQAKGRAWLKPVNAHAATQRELLAWTQASAATLTDEQATA